MFEIKKKWFLVSNISFFILLVLVWFFAMDNFDDIFLDFNGRVFEPLQVWNLALIIISVILMFFSQDIFNRWFKFVFVWLFPILFLMSMTAGTTGFGFDSTDYAYVDGWILGIVTIVFALIQKFWYKR